MLMQSIIFHTGTFITYGEALVTVATSLYMDVEDYFRLLHFGYIVYNYCIASYSF